MFELRIYPTITTSPALLLRKTLTYIDVNIVSADVHDFKAVKEAKTFNVVKAALPGIKNRSNRKPISIVFMSSQAGGHHHFPPVPLQLRKDVPDLDIWEKHQVNQSLVESDGI
nr:hypothetical protein [Tanacetum cinerariifolium]